MSRRHCRQPTGRLTRAARNSAVAAAFLATACGVLPPEEQLLKRFFEASRLHDTTVVSALSNVTFNPVEDGVVGAFEIRDVMDAGAMRRLAVDATVRQPDGTVVERTLQVTMQRRDGRWVITSLR